MFTQQGRRDFMSEQSSHEDGASSGRRNDENRSIFLSMDRLLADVAGVLLLLLAFGTVGSSVSRYLTGASIPDFETMAAMALVGVVFLPMAFAQSTRSNVEVTIFSDGLSAQWRRRLTLFGFLIGILAVGLLAYAMGLGAKRAYVTGDIVLGVMRLDTWPARTAAVVGLVALTLRLVLDLFSGSRRPRGKVDNEPKYE